ncbi:hypothetical protein [Serinibacter arcticus]|uniref:Uncharacterized protein n=1 Tax=Serinibacter arcticus TaxID=1655435 RepID=A0A4Z1E1S5_9MICO|nr:hypothetical protein [Serinibacter arcticus]TGO05924.1 hypothetical protein SERN_0116 [Serinibacter arcticus]
MSNSSFPSFFVIFGVVIAIIVVSGVVSARRSRERTQALVAYAAARGWLFHADGTGLEDRFGGEPFQRGRRRRASQVLEGTHRGWPFIAFDYTYVTSNGKNSTTHHFSVVSLHLGVRTPMLQVRPQSAFGRFFSDAFGTDYHIGFREFDDAFHIRTDSTELAHDVLTEAFCRRLLAAPERALRFQGDSLLLFRTGRHDPAEVDAVLEQGSELLALVPAPVWERLRGVGGPTDAPV